MKGEANGVSVQEAQFVDAQSIGIGLPLHASIAGYGSVINAMTPPLCEKEQGFLVVDTPLIMLYSTARGTQNSTGGGSVT